MAANLTGGGKRMAAEYREAHPQVAMRMEHQGGSHSDSGARLRLSFRSETGPGIIHEPHDVNLTSLMSAGFTAPAPDDLVAIIEGRRSPRTRSCFSTIHAALITWQCQQYLYHAQVQNPSCADPLPTVRPRGYVSFCATPAEMSVLLDGEPHDGMPA